MFRRWAIVLVALILLLDVSGVAQAGWLQIAGSPALDPATITGFQGGQVPVNPGWGVNNGGTAVGYANKTVPGGTLGYRAVRWDASGTAAELGNLGTGIGGFTAARAYAINDVGTTVGNADAYVGSVYKGSRAVRWDAGGTATTELDNLGTSSGGITSATAYAINTAGAAVGTAEKYVSGVDKGSRAVRWDAGGTAAIELGNLGVGSGDVTSAIAYAINDAGIVVGQAEKYLSGVDVGGRAVRWDAAGVATELDNLGTNGSGSTYAYALAVNGAGTAVGQAQKYVGGVDKGSRAVRWEAGGTAATELGNLGTDGSDYTSAVASAVNGSGTTVGQAEKYVGGVDKGSRAVRWDGSDAAAIELGSLGTDIDGVTYAYAYAVNDAGTAVGNSNKYVGGSSVGRRAVVWLPDATAIDLNDLGVVSVPTGGTWTLTTAKAISADGWVAGEGVFDPDGGGPLAGYNRLWVTQVGLGGAWTNVAGGTWGRGPNWSTGTPAMQVGNATFNLDSTYAVALDRDELTKTIAVNAGTVTIACNGHTLTTESGLNVASGATLKTNGGTIVSGIVNAGSVQIGDGGTTGGLTGNVTNDGSLIFNRSNSYTFLGSISGSGSVEKRGAGKLTLAAANTYDGPTTVAGGAIELTQAAQDCVFNRGGADIQAGTMVFDYNSAVSPAATVKSLLTASYHGGLWDVGQFRNSTAASSGLTLGWFDDGSSEVTVMATYAGDFNLDGVVSDIDLDVWKANAGHSGATWQTGDANYDGVVNLLDLDQWKAHVGLPPVGGNSASGSAVGVPEPGTLAMLAAGVLGLLGCAWRRRRGRMV